MTNLIQADFNGTNVLFKNDAYLNATSIAKRFNKQPRDYLKSSRTKEYINALINLQKTIKTKILIEENQLVIVKAGSAQNGGGTWLHPKLAIDFARWLSAEFAVWCDEQIEKILHGKQTEQPKLDQLSTSDDRVPLRQAISKLVTKRGLSYSDAYIMVNQRFNHEHLEEYTLDEVPEAIQYVHELTMSNLMEGELMPREELTTNDDLYRGIAMMEKAIKIKLIQERKLQEMHAYLIKAQTAYDDAMKCDGAIWEGIHDAQVHFDVDKTRRSKAEKLAQDNFEHWKSQRAFMA